MNGRGFWCLGGLLLQSVGESVCNLEPLTSHAHRDSAPCVAWATEGRLALVGDAARKMSSSLTYIAKDAVSLDETDALNSTPKLIGDLFDKLLSERFGFLQEGVFGDLLFVVLMETLPEDIIN